MKDQDELEDTKQRSSRIFTRYPTRPAIYTEYKITHNACSESEPMNVYDPAEKERSDVR